MATVALESTGRRQSEERAEENSDWNNRESALGHTPRRRAQLLPGRETRARNARMRRCLKLRQGARPLRPPAPFPSESMFQNGGNLSRVRKPRNNGAPLTDSLRSADSPEIRERGPQPSAPHVPPPVGRHAVQNQGRRTARYARMRRCLKLCQGASPLRPPQWPLTQAGLLMEAVTVRAV